MTFADACKPKYNNSGYKVSESDSLQSRSENYKKVLKETRNPREAVEAYVSGNKWAEENAKAVGNL